MRLLVLGCLMLVSVAGCLSDDDGPATTTDVIPDEVREENLETLTFAEAGSFIAGTPSVGPFGGSQCGLPFFGVAQHTWEIPDETDDGIPQRVRYLSVEFGRQDLTALDLNIYVFDDEGEMVAEASGFDPMSGFGVAAEASDLAAGTYTIQVEACLAAVSQYELEGRAEMVSIGALTDVVGDAGDAGDGVSYQRGQVRTEQRDGRWHAYRTDEYEGAVTARQGDATISTGAGSVAFEATGTRYALEVELIGRGESEQQARDRLAAIRVDHHLEQDPAIDLGVHARTADRNWEGRTASFTFRVPSSVIWDSWSADVGAGAISISGIDAARLSADTAAGAIRVADVMAHDMTLDTSAGAIEASMDPPEESGTWSLDTSAGAIELKIVETRSVGYDIDAETSAGGVEFRLDEARTVSEDCEYASCHKTARTEGYDDRLVKTRISMDTSAGSITAWS